MKKLVYIALFATLAGCGVDGPPQPPAETGVSVTGDARIGVVARL